MIDSLRIGCVKYLNAQPLIHGWDGPVDLDHPAALCRRLAEGELDVAFVSSFEFLRDPIYTIVDGVAVGSDGPVYSVFVAHRGKIEDVTEIHLDPASQTSVNLLRCLLAERRLRPRLVPLSEADGESITLDRARLMIGDQAIAFRQRDVDACEYWDLGAAWKESFDLPFVFALWLIRPEVNDPSGIANRLRLRRDANLHALDEVIAAQEEFSADFCSVYFQENLRFGFAEPEKKGFLHFRSLCQKHGLLPPDPVKLRLA